MQAIQKVNNQSRIHSSGSRVADGVLALSKTYSYTYYPNGLRKTYTNPEGITYTYYYNKINELTAAHIPGNGQMSLTDFFWQQPQTLLLPGGGKITLSYNDFLQVKERILEDPANNNVAEAIYRYDLESNIEEIATSEGRYDFQYDRNYRLTGADYPGLIAANDEEFGYDGVGNRTRHTTMLETGTGEAEPKEQTLVYNDQNQLIESGSASFTYNANGHTETKTDNGQITEYIYNHEERLIEVKVNGQTVGQYAYNPEGHRIKKTVNGTTTYFLYNEEGLAAEYDAHGNLIKEYHFKPYRTWMTEPLFQRTADGQVYYYQNDHLGTPQRMIRSNGAVVWQAYYSAFGEAEVVTQTVENNLRFPGQYYDRETGLHHNFHRDYAPVLGRYVQVDPIGFRGGVNVYTYASSNPLIRMDPEGLSWIPILRALGAEAACAKIEEARDQYLEDVAKRRDDSLAYEKRQLEIHDSYCRDLPPCERPECRSENPYFTDEAIVSINNEYDEKVKNDPYKMKWKLCSWSGVMVPKSRRPRFTEWRMN